MTTINLAKIKDLINQIPNHIKIENILIFPEHIELKITGRIGWEELSKESNKLESIPSLDPFDHPSSQDPTNLASNKLLDNPNQECYHGIMPPKDSSNNEDISFEKYLKMFYV